MKKRKVLLVLLILICVMLIMVVALFANFCIINVKSICGSKPYLLRAKIVDQSLERTTFSNIEPMVIFDATDVIAIIRDVKVGTPSSKSTFTIEGDDFKNYEVGESLWLKFSDNNSTLWESPETERVEIKEDRRVVVPLWGGLES